MESSSPLSDEAAARLLQTKIALCWTLSSDLLTLDIPTIYPLEFPRGSDEETKENLRAKHREKIRQRDAKIKLQEPNLLAKINDLIIRVKSSEGDEPIDHIDYNQNDTVVSMNPYKCPLCGNDETKDFDVDSRTSQVTCMGRDRVGCGCVLVDHAFEKGAEFRNFADEEKDRNHHGQKPEPLLSEAENLRTKMQFAVKDKNAKLLLQASQRVEMDLSKVGNDERRTRTGYRDQQKREAISKLEQHADRLQLNKKVLGKREWGSVNPYVFRRTIYNDPNLTSLYTTYDYIQIYR
jgi:hypothetical protein